MLNNKNANMVLNVLVVFVILFAVSIPLFGFFQSGVDSIDAIQQDCKSLIPDLNGDYWNGVCRHISMNCLEDESDQKNNPLLTKSCYVKGETKNDKLRCCIPNTNPTEKIQVISIIEEKESLLMAKKTKATIYTEEAETIDVSFKVTNIPEEYFVYDKIDFILYAYSTTEKCFEGEDDSLTFSCSSTESDCIFPAPLVSGEGGITYKPQTLKLGSCRLEIKGYKDNNETFVKKGSIYIDNGFSS